MTHPYRTAAPVPSEPELTPAEKAERRRQERLAAIRAAEERDREDCRQLLGRIAELPEGTIAELTLDEILLLRRRASGDVTIAEPFPLPLPAGFDTGMRVFGHPVHCKP